MNGGIVPGCRREQQPIAATAKPPKGAVPAEKEKPIFCDIASAGESAMDTASSPCENRVSDLSRFHPVSAAGVPTNATGSVPRVQADGTAIFHLKDAKRIAPPFERVADSTAADGTAIVVPAHAGRTPGELECSLHLPVGGVFALWIRAWWGDSCGNSIWLQINDEPPVIVQDATYKTWHWVLVRFPGQKPADAVELKAGRHRLVLRNREEGIKLDQVFLTPWHADAFQRRIPQGIE